MIVGHGIDLQEISAIKKAYDKRSTFAKKVLTEREFDKFQTLKGNRQMTFLAGRWAAKEAFAKALGTGIGPVIFHEIEVLNDEKGKPILTSPAFTDGKIWLSISHSSEYVQASVILERKSEV